MRLTQATVADAPAMTRLFLASRRAAMPWLPDLHAEPEVLRWMAETVIAQTQVSLAVTPEGLSGFASLTPGWLDHLYVEPAAQGSGVGARLLRAAMEANPQGLRLYVFQRNARARAFYERHGFRLETLRDGSHNEENEPDAVYVWTPIHPAPETD